MHTPTIFNALQFAGNTTTFNSTKRDSSKSNFANKNTSKCRLRQSRFYKFLAPLLSTAFLLLLPLSGNAVSHTNESNNSINLGLGKAISAEKAAQAINAIMAEYVKPGEPGCSVGMAKNSQWLHKQGYGLSNLELNTPLTGDNVHRMASVSKQFTAMAIWLLADEGKIDLQQDIKTYLPELPDYGHKISVNEMLGHIAGMGDYDMITNNDEDPQANSNNINLRSVAGGPFRLGNRDYLSIQEFYEVVKTVPLRQQPRSSWDYSNLAYFLLSMLIEEVSGESIRDYANKRIFMPLGMNNTFFSDDADEIVRQRAYGYGKNEQGEYINQMTNLFWSGDGGLHTNLDDMLIWDANFYQAKLGRDPQDLIRKFNAPNSQFTIGDTSKLYANGQILSEHEQLGQVYQHSGGWLGTSTYYLRAPKEKLSIMLMCNNTSINPTQIKTKLLEWYISKIKGEH